MESTAALSTRQLVAHLDELLEVDRFRDYGPNGLQVQGAETVRRVVTGVSACLELIAHAVERRADALLVHHGIFWDGMPSPLVGFQYHRVAELVQHKLALIAYHLPLDAHPQFGNNAVACQRLGLESVVPFGQHAGTTIGFSGSLPRPLPAANIAALLEQLYGQTPLVFPFGPDPVRTIGIISGGAQKELHQAIAAGLDVYVTGEVSEWVMNVARESGIHYAAAGHHATERLGVQALGTQLAKRFGIEVEFIDVPNPV